MINGRKKKYLLPAFLSAIIVLVGILAIVLVWEGRVERQFPLWKTPCLEADESRCDPDVKLRFTGIDFDVPLASGAICDRVLIKLKGVPGKPIYYGYLVWVDYFHNGEWHTVWSNDYTVLSSTGINGSDVTEEEIAIYESVSPGLFARDGQYRIFIDGLGYCGIDMIGTDAMK